MLNQFFNHNQKLFDLNSIMGSISSLAFAGISFSNIEAGLSMLSVIIAIITGVVTIIYTQEKRRELKDNRSFRNTPPKKDKDDDD